MIWACGLRANRNEVDPHRPWVVSNGHFKVYFREVTAAVEYRDFQNARLDKA